MHRFCLYFYDLRFYTVSFFFNLVNKLNMAYILLFLHSVFLLGHILEFCCESLLVLLQRMAFHWDWMLNSRFKSLKILDFNRNVCYPKQSTS